MIKVKKLKNKHYIYFIEIRKLYYRYLCAKGAQFDNL